MDRKPPPDHIIVKNLNDYCLRYANNRKNQEEERAPGDIIQARFLNPEMARKGLLDLLEQANKGRLAMLDYKGNFNPINQCYELKKKWMHYTVDHSNRQNRFIFGRLKILIETLLANIDLNKPRVSLSLTGVRYKVRSGYRSYYSLVFPSRSPPSSSFSKSLISDDILRICSTLQCTRGSLRVHIKDAGWFAGDFRFKIDNNVIVGGLSRYPGLAGLTIPNVDLETMREVIIPDAINGILIIENHAFYSVLWQLHYHTRFNLIMVNVSGQPDLTAREFIYRVCAAVDWKLPVFCLCDLDVGGHMIAKVLKFGNPNAAFMYNYSHCKNLQWMGIRPSDIGRYGLQQDLNSDDPFSDFDRQRLRAYLDNFSHFSLDWKEELEKMLDLPHKVKLQARGIVDKYLLCKLEDVSHWGEP